MNKRKLIIVLGLVCGVSISMNIYQIYSDLKQSSYMERKINNKSEKIKQQKNKINALRDKVEILNKNVSNKAVSSSQENFNSIVSKFINVMFEYTPNSYQERKEKVSLLISDELLKRYFPKGNYGDANDVTSRVDKVNIYRQSERQGNINGLAVITFESKIGDSDFQKRTEIYQLTMNTKTNRLIKIQDLGNVTRGKDIDDS